MTETMYLADTIANLAWLNDRWPDLHEARHRGTARPWREPETTREQREQQDWLARVERAEADGRMPGYSRAPLHVDVLDTLVDILATAETLHDQVAQTIGHDRLPPAASAYDDPRRFIGYVIELLPEAADADPHLAAYAGRRAATMRDQARRALGEIADGHRIKAVCPFCLGVTATAPGGGAWTLRIRVIPKPTEGRDATEPVVVCEGGTCSPLGAECSNWVRGDPAWPWPEWDWLSGRIAHVNGALTA